MCLIVVKNKDDSSFSVEDFRASQGRNSDGTGIMYVENGRVVVEKTMGPTPKDHLDLYYKHMNKPQFILHHRMATQGEKTERNCHPFKVLSIDDGDPYDLYFVHNGNIGMSKFSGDYDKTLSDTHLFALQYLTPLMRQYPDIIDNKVFQYMLHDLIGTGNKLAFLRNDGKIWIFNKQQGDEHNGCWLSNKYSINSNKVTTTTHYAQQHGHRNYGYGHGYNRQDETNYDYEDGSWWRNHFNTANSAKTKLDTMESNLSPDEILTAIQEYAGMPVDLIEALVIEETALAFDMLNFLSEKPLNKLIMDDPAHMIAGKLYDLLQGYSKKLNIAA